MKILQINKLYYPVIGGVETVVKDIADGLNGKEDLLVDVLVCQKKGRRQEEVISGVKVYRAASIGKVFGMPLSFDFFRLFFKIKHKYDLFVVHYPFPLASFLTLFIPREKLTIYYHSDIIKQKFLRIPFLPTINLSLNRANKILVTGKNIMESSSSLKKHKNKCEVVPLGVDFNFVNNDYEEAKKISLNYSKNKLILAVGRLVYYKGFEYAIKSMVEVDASLLIIGQGPKEGKLRGLIRKLRLEKKVFIISFQEKLSPFFLAADIFIFPSTERSEAFGLVQLEAMAAGKPVINTYLKTAVEEVSLDGVSGLTVEAKNSKGLSNAINILLNNDDVRLRYGENAKKRYKELFTKDMFLKRFIDSVF